MGMGKSTTFLIASMLLLSISSLPDVTEAANYIVGGPDQKWNFLQADDNITWYDSVWAANHSFKTGDNIIFDYNNNSHSVVQLGTETDFDTCNLNNRIQTFDSGLETFFISNSGTFFYVCGVPSHCQQGMKVRIVATGAPATAPPAGSTSPLGKIPPAPSPSQAPLSLLSGTLVLILITALAAHGVTSLC